eukprot:TRINITY_DN3240_c0_g1_i2.p1 TRINITY_DN3240_c0_g1~~TRINITY_DN3240_c0_g1_i2.p1  ORF type:complete len:567 (+),score=160.22 TRINITY_DN3240_c0_g1_i2:661-2361(+)
MAVETLANEFTENNETMQARVTSTEVTRKKQSVMDSQTTEEMTSNALTSLLQMEVARKKQSVMHSQTTEEITSNALTSLLEMENVIESQSANDQLTDLQASCLIPELSRPSDDSQTSCLVQESSETAADHQSAIVEGLSDGPSSDMLDEGSINCMLSLCTGKDGNFNEVSNKEGSLSLADQNGLAKGIQGTLKDAENQNSEDGNNNARETPGSDTEKRVADSRIVEKSISLEGVGEKYKENDHREVHDNGPTDFPTENCLCILNKEKRVLNAAFLLAENGRVVIEEQTKLAKEIPETKKDVKKLNSEDQNNGEIEGTNTEYSRAEINKDDNCSSLQYASEEYNESDQHDVSDISTSKAKEMSFDATNKQENALEHVFPQRENESMIIEVPEAKKSDENMNSKDDTQNTVSEIRTVEYEIKLHSLGEHFKELNQHDVPDTNIEDSVVKEICGSTMNKEENISKPRSSQEENEGLGTEEQSSFVEEVTEIKRDVKNMNSEEVNKAREITRTDTENTLPEPRSSKEEYGSITTEEQSSFVEEATETKRCLTNLDSEEENNAREIPGTNH